MGRGGTHGKGWGTWEGVGHMGRGGAHGKEWGTWEGVGHMGRGGTHGKGWGTWEGVGHMSVKAHGLLQDVSPAHLHAFALNLLNQ